MEVRGEYPEIYEIPKDPKKVPWPKRTLAEINWGEEFLTFDLNKDGHPDIMAGPFYLQNDGKGYFTSHNLIDPALDVKVARFRMADIDEDGDKDLVMVEDLSYQVKEAFFARFAWFENPNDIGKMP